MKKNVFNLAIASLFTLVAGTANALVVDTFDQYSTDATSTGSDWRGIVYTGTGIYNNSTRLLIARDGNSNVYAGATTVKVSATDDDFTSSIANPNTIQSLETRVYYGTGVGAFYSGNGGFASPPSTPSADQFLQLNISASLTDSFYFDIGSSGTATVSFYSSTGSVLGSRSLTFTAGSNSYLLSSFNDLLSSEASDIDGIGFSFQSSVTKLTEVGFNITPTSAVPEPETYAMFMAGLGLLGFASRRKKA